MHGLKPDWLGDQARAQVQERGVRLSGRKDLDGVVTGSPDLVAYGFMGSCSEKAGLGSVKKFRRRQHIAAAPTQRRILTDISIALAG